MINAIIGGALIGISASIMLLFTGRVTGISGIMGGILNPKSSDKGWRFLFIAGLVVGGLVMVSIQPDNFVVKSVATNIDYVIAGLLVGFGTLLGNGCTSGHGVCGLSRFSSRSFVATITFMAMGILSTLIFRLLRGEI
ncbi:MAG: YeeE/YedE family protein [Bacteriovoracaceae bacterium]|nr:YeeE/YedE family protein [Bacteriovoracaceae bacterium]